MGDEAGITLVERGEGASAPGRRGEPAAARLSRRAARGPRLERRVGCLANRGLEHDPGGAGPGKQRGRDRGRAAPGCGIGRRSPDADELLLLATQIEGHPDNVAAALYGGFTLAVAARGPVQLRRFRVPEAWVPVVFIAQRESRTSEMRAALPDSVPYGDAVAQAARGALLATAVITSDAGLLREAMDDRLHQPYRLPLLNGSAELIAAAYEHGAAGACLSGRDPA